MEPDAHQPKPSILTGLTWFLGSVVAAYMLLFAAILFSGGRAVRALNAVGISGHVLDFLYGWLIDLFEP